MRKAGAPLRMIADELGMSIPGVHKIIRNAIRDVEQLSDVEAADLRRITCERFDAMILGIWDKARTGKFGAIDRVVSIELARHRILGTMGAQRVDLGVDGDTTLTVTVEEARSRLQALFERRLSEARLSDDSEPE